MSYEEKVRAWKDPEQRAGSNSADHPAGEIALERVVGGNAITWMNTCAHQTVICCSTIGEIDCWPQTPILE